MAEITTKTFQYGSELWDEIQDRLPVGDNYASNFPWSLKNACTVGQEGIFVVAYDENGVAIAGCGTKEIQTIDTINGNIVNDLGFGDKKVIQIGWRGWSNLRYAAKNGMTFRYIFPVLTQYAKDQGYDIELVTFNIHNEQLKNSFMDAVSGKRGEILQEILHGFSIPVIPEYFNFINQYVCWREIPKG